MTPDALDAELNAIARLLPGMAASLRLVLGPGTFESDLYRAADAELQHVVLPEIASSEADRVDAISRLASLIRRPVHIRRWPIVAREMDELNVPATERRKYLVALVEEAVTTWAGPVLVLPDAVFAKGRAMVAKARLLRSAVNNAVTTAVLGDGWRASVEQPTAPNDIDACPTQSSVDGRVRAKAAIARAAVDRAAMQLARCFEVATPQQRKLIEVHLALLRANPNAKVTRSDVARAIGIKPQAAHSQYNRLAKVAGL